MKRQEALVIAKKAGNIAGWVVLVLLITILLSLVLGTKGKLPLLKDYRLFSVMSGSMEDTLSVGGLVLVKKEDPLALKQGDIITFLSNDPLYNGSVVTHRIQEVLDYQDSVMFITKGDANDETDSAAVIPPNLIGRVILHIPLLGYVFQFLQTKVGYFVVLMVPCFILLVLEVISLIRNIMAYQEEMSRKSGALEDAAALEPPEKPEAERVTEKPVYLGSPEKSGSERAAEKPARMELPTKPEFERLVIKSVHNDRSIMSDEGGTKTETPVKVAAKSDKRPTSAQNQNKPAQSTVAAKSNAAGAKPKSTGTVKQTQKNNQNQKQGHPVHRKKKKKKRR